MIYELHTADYNKVRPLFRALEYHLTSAAVLDGHNPGRVFVDDPVNPQAAFMFSPEGCYLAGKSDNDAFNRTLNNAIHAGQVSDERVEALALICHPESWEQQLAVVLDPWQPARVPRRHYVCREVKYDWRANIPNGYAVHCIDAALLGQSGLKIPDHIQSWMENNWGSVIQFLQSGFGLVTIHADHAGAAQVASWSLADCRSGEACEIGIRTAEAYRRQGLATITAAAAVQYALSHGYMMVGWQCSEDNLGSIRTAEKIGFERERDYALYYVILREQ
jgi:RimJ/RimL family protein N-acetyltransferase